MPRFVYAGPAEQVFPQYIDKATGGTLVAVPGKAHDIAQVAGLTVPDGEGGLIELKLAMPPNDDFKPATRSAQNGSN